jgi:hypothetical protein
MRPSISTLTFSLYSLASTAIGLQHSIRALVIEFERPFFESAA